MLVDGSLEVAVHLVVQPKHQKVDCHVFRLVERQADDHAEDVPVPVMGCFGGLY